MKQKITTIAAVLFAAGLAQAGILAGQDFDAEIFSSGAESGSTYFNRTDNAPLAEGSSEQVKVELLGSKAAAAKGFIRIWFGVQ